MSDARKALDDLVELTGDVVPVLDGFDAALIGTATVHCGHSSSLRAVYDRELCIKVLMDRDRMDREEAAEFFDYNVVGAAIADAPVIFSQLQT